MPRPLQCQRTGDVPTCSVLFKWHVGSCPSRTVLHFGFSWRCQHPAMWAAHKEPFSPCCHLSSLTLPLCLLPYLALSSVQSGHCILPGPEPPHSVRGLLFRDPLPSGALFMVAVEQCGSVGKRRTQIYKCFKLSPKPLSKWSASKINLAF